MRVESGGEGEEVGAVLGNCGRWSWLTGALAPACLGDLAFVAGWAGSGFATAALTLELGRPVRPDAGTAVVANGFVGQNPGRGLVPVSSFENAMVARGAGEDSRCEW